MPKPSAKIRSTPEKPPISDAEWTVMKAVWRQSPATANQVVAALEGQTSWKPKTIHTLLARLVRKGVLSANKQGREYAFVPRLAEEECLHAESRSFLERLFDGRLAPFLACFVEREDLTAEEIKELKRLLDRKRK